MGREISDDLLQSILKILLQIGIRETTMSSIASELGMSKRTLYELFGSKNEMVLATLDYHHALFGMRSREIIRTSPDMMSAMTQIYGIQRDFLCKANVKFLQDMHSLYPEIHKRYEGYLESRMVSWEEMYMKGVDQGVFRPGVNLRTLTRLLHIQMEALKRMEENFPPDVSLMEVYDTICNSFLHSIASHKGMDMLEKLEIKNKS